VKSIAAFAVLLIGAASPGNAGAQIAPAAPPVPSLSLARPEAAGGAPPVITLADALQRAKKYEATFLSAVADAASAGDDIAQAKAGLLPAVSATTQYIGNQESPALKTGRFVSMDGVNMYRAWLVAHEELSPGAYTGATLRKAQAAEAAARAKLEIAQRGLVVTVTRNYYGFISAERKYATAQLAAQQAQRFFDIAQQQERLGQVARSDVVKAEISARQQRQAFDEAALAMDNARNSLAILLFPTFNENFSVVDDMQSAPALPPFTDVRALAERGNPDLRAAAELLRVAGADIQVARSAFLPSLVIEGVYGIEANEFALHSRVSADPELGVLPNLGYALTVNLSVPLWDGGATRAKVRQGETRERQASASLSQAQRQLVSSLYSMYNEALTARAAMDGLRRVAELATESLRLTTLRYQAGESTALEMVDAQTTTVQARNAADDAEARYRVAIASLQTLTGSF
jgi:outer membrane protein TolC